MCGGERNGGEQRRGGAIVTRGGRARGRRCTRPDNSHPVPDRRLVPLCWFSTSGLCSRGRWWGGGERRHRRGRPAVSPPPRLSRLSVPPPRQSGRHLPRLRRSRHSQTSTTPPAPPPPPPPRCCCPPPPAHPRFTGQEGERRALDVGAVPVGSPGPPGGGCGPPDRPPPVRWRRQPPRCWRCRPLTLGSSPTRSPRCCVAPLATDAAARHKARLLPTIRVWQRIVAGRRSIGCGGPAATARGPRATTTGLTGPTPTPPRRPLRWWPHHCHRGGAAVSSLAPPPPFRPDQQPPSRRSAAPHPQ